MMKNLIRQCDLADAAPQATTLESEPLPTVPIEKPKVDAEVRMFRGTGLASAACSASDELFGSNPLLWHEAGKLDRVRLRRAIIRAAQEGWLIPADLQRRVRLNIGYGGDGCAHFDDGSKVAVSTLIDQERRDVYDMMASGASDPVIRNTLLVGQALIDQIRKQFFLT
jgi:hypothetical protein